MGCDDCEATVRRVAGVVCVTDFAGRVAPFTQQAESVIGVDPGVDPPEAWGQVRVAATGVQVGGEMVMTVDGDVLTATVAAHVAEPTPDTPDVPSVEELLADLLEAL